MIQPDDKIVIEAVRGNGAAGTPNASRADRDFAAIRLNANGTRDQGFGTDGVASIGAVFTENGQTIQAVENPRQGVIQPDGKIVLGGYAQVNGLERPLLARFNANGTPDTTLRRQRRRARASPPRSRTARTARPRSTSSRCRARAS